MFEWVRCISWRLLTCSRTITWVSLGCLDPVQVAMPCSNCELFLRPVQSICMMAQAYNPLLCVVLPSWMTHFSFWCTCLYFISTALYILHVCTRLVWLAGTRWRCLVMREGLFLWCLDLCWTLPRRCFKLQSPVLPLQYWKSWMRQRPRPALVHGLCKVE